MPIIPPYFMKTPQPTTPRTQSPLSPRPIATASPIPQSANPKPKSPSKTTESSRNAAPIPPTPNFPTPLLRIHLQDLSHEGTSIFLTNTHGHEDLNNLLQRVLSNLYLPTSKRPGTRSITLVLREMDGVAYTTGLDLDADHKEIHLNLNYITAITKRSPTSTPPRHEILGVLCHELVHCFQYSANDTCPGGLIEGIADFVRLRSGYGAAHWKREAGGRWDQGYQHTGYFLEFLEGRFGEGTVRGINACLGECEEWDEEIVFGRCCGGLRVGELWEEYQRSLNGSVEESPVVAEAVPTCAVPAAAAVRECPGGWI